MRTTKRILAGLLCICIVFSGFGMLAATSVSAATVDGGRVKTISSQYGYQDNEYSYHWNRYGRTLKSYLYQNPDKSYTRVQYAGESGVLVEQLTKKLKISSSKLLKMELPIFGGFFHGTEHNYLVFGQRNDKESDSCEVMRVVKYTHDWKRVSACSIYGANTYIPFDAGSLRMAEENGKLFLHTCHEMYVSSDGKHHQANMSFVVNQNTMQVTEQSYLVENNRFGYSSHSFNQFIAIDGNDLYTLNHGDAYPRSFQLCKTTVEPQIDPTSYWGRAYYAEYDIYDINGNTGANDTYCTIGSFAVGKNNIITACTSIDQKVYDPDGQYNVLLLITNKSTMTTKQVWLTDYSGGTIYPPQLAALPDGSYLVMWQYSTSKSEGTNMVRVDENGNKLCKTVKTPFALSSCTPIITADGKVMWYTTKSNYSTNQYDTTIYQIDPYNLSQYNANRVENLEITVEAQSYTGKKITPDIMVNGAKLTKGKHYTLTYKNNTKIGTATVYVKGKGSYSGTRKLNFDIVPPAPKEPTLSVKNGKLTLRWNAVKAADGYQINYIKGYDGEEKLYTTVSAKTTSVTFKSKNYKNEVYYYRIRCFVKIDGKTYYSPYSYYANTWRYLEE